MKIEKYKKDFENNYEGLDYPVESDYTVGFTHDRIFIRTLDKNNYLVITLESQDILKLMTWLVGQEKHNQEVTTRTDKDKENQKIVNFLNSEWQQCVNQIELLESMCGSIYEPKITQEEFNTKAAHYLDQKEVLERIYLRATGKDIKDL